jgi:hypothetical protein
VREVWAGKEPHRPLWWSSDLRGRTPETLLTSNDVRAADTAGTRSRADEFAAALVAEVAGAEYDFVIGVDDLELANAPHPERVVKQVIDAIERHIAGLRVVLSEQNRLRDRVQARCSFHLLAPMVESYFFAEPTTALRTCGAQRPSMFRVGAVDVEDFAVSDPAFDAVPYPAHAPREARKKTWALPANRHRHPKAYLKFLCEPNDPLCSERLYRESRHGASALGALSWGPALSGTTHGQLARSLFDDIANMLGVPPPFAGASHAATSRPGPQRRLRNA